MIVVCKQTGAAFSARRRFHCSSAEAKKIVSSPSSTAFANNNNNNNNNQKKKKKKKKKYLNRVGVIANSSTTAASSSLSNGIDVLDLIDVPLELVQIRAYVRWEEAGKPEGMPPDWQQAEFARALEDLRMEIIEGVSLNEIRRRFNMMQNVQNDGADDLPMKLPKEVEDWKLSRQIRNNQQQQQQEQRRVVTAEEILQKKITTRKSIVSMSSMDENQEFTFIEGGASGSFDDDEYDVETNNNHNVGGAVILVPVVGSTTISTEKKEEKDEEVGHHRNHNQVKQISRAFDASSIYDLIPKKLSEYEDGSIGTSDSESSLQAKSFMRRWRRQADQQSISDEKDVICTSKLYPLGNNFELLVQIFERTEFDSAATSGERSRKTNRRVKFVTDYPEPLTLHWGVARDEPGQWILPPASTQPTNTTLVSHMSAETPLKDAGEGCLVDLVDMKAPMTGERVGQECRQMQNLSIYLPDSDSATEIELMGVHFVLRDDKNNWFKDATNGNQNFAAMLQGAGDGRAKPTDELTNQIIRAEAGGNWWSLMHRYNLAHSMLDAKIGADGIDPSKALVRIAKIFVWLRFSQLRQLTWQRNYNVKPRELSSAQLKLTRKLAELFCERPELRDLARLSLETVGRGGDSGTGQAVRDEILNIMHRNNIKEVSGVFLEEWHQKLHNNTSPDDIVICEAYLAFLRGNSDLKAYWKVLSDGGVTKQIMESYERPIKAEPIPRPTIAKDLIRDFENYLTILKAVHSGADLKMSIDVCCKERNYLKFSQALQYCRQYTDKVGNEKALLEACIQARHEVRNAGLKQMHNKDVEKVRELLYLDLALGGVSSRAVQRAELTKDVGEALQFSALALEDLCLSLPASCEDLALSLVEMQRVISSRNEDLSDDDDAKNLWALRAKATVDRARTAVAAYGDSINSSMQATAESIGFACNCENWTITHFSEEVIRGGPAFGLSLALTRLDKMLRQEANLGAWSIISPKTTKVIGRVEFYPTLREIMNEDFRDPTIIVCQKVGGDEEIPKGIVALLTPSSVDVLSHSAVRARNSDVLFATCHDLSVLDSLCEFVNEFASTRSFGADSSVKIEKATEAEIAATSKHKLEDDKALSMNSGNKKEDLEKRAFCGKFAVSLDEFKPKIVGAKSRNTRTLRESLESSNLPSWINLPRSIAIPFGTFDYVLDSSVNKDKKQQFLKLIDQIDDSTGDTLEDTLNRVRSCVKSLEPPNDARDEIARVMLAGDMTPPDTKEKWEKAWRALVSVWASKWNERAYVSVRNRGLTHKNLQMAILVQPVIDADYAFVIHTTSPANNNENELYAEIVKGLGETLVGNYPGRALSFKADKTDGVNKPVITGFPSKNVALSVSPGTLIFRSDSNGEDLAGYAGAGLYESVPTEQETVTHVDYSKDKIVWNHEGMADEIMKKITEAGMAIEKALGCAQDIEGCVKDGKVYIVQTRPQV